MVVRSSKNKCNIGISGGVIAEFRHILLICTENLCLKSISKNENIICILYKEKSYIIDLHLMKINPQDKIKKKYKSIFNSYMFKFINFDSKNLWFNLVAKKYYD